MVARLLRWDDEAGCIKYDEGAMIKVEGDQEATVGQLKVRVVCGGLYNHTLRAIGSAY